MLIVPLFVLSTAAFADEFTHYAEVLESEPVTLTKRSDRMPATCFQGKPDTFDAILLWDVGCQLPQVVEHQAYRVRYDINGKVFTTTLDSPPGDKLPVRLSFN